MNSKTFMIPTMMEADAEIIQTELEQMAGVREVRIHLSTHTVTVAWSAPATWEEIDRRLQELNFAPDLPRSNF
jgi:hypothetical protein